MIKRSLKNHKCPENISTIDAGMSQILETKNTKKNTETKLLKIASRRKLLNKKNLNHFNN